MLSHLRAPRVEAVRGDVRLGRYTPMVDDVNTPCRRPGLETGPRRGRRRHEYQRSVRRSVRAVARRAHWHSCSDSCRTTPSTRAIWVSESIRVVVSRHVHQEMLTFFFACTYLLAAVRFLG